MNRRVFLKSAASVIAIVAACPSLTRAWPMPRTVSGSSGFNGGKTQGQANFPAFGGDFPFINLIKSTGNIWLISGGTGSLSDGYDLSPSGYDENGYPSAAYLNANSIGAKILVPLPNQFSRPATSSRPLVLTWEGNANLSIAFSNAVRGGGSGPKFNKVTGRWTGRYEWYPTYVSDPRNGRPVGFGECYVEIKSIASGSYVNNVQLYFKDDEAALNSGEVFGVKFKQTLQQANFGAFRFMDWLLTSTSNVTTWGTRKSVNYPTWCGYEFRASLFCGITNNIGNDYSLTIPGTYAWTNPVQGSYNPGGGPVDKMTIHLGWNADATMVQNSTSLGSYAPSGTPTLTIINFNPLTFGWPSNPLVNGNPVSIWTTAYAIQGFYQGQTYYVVNATRSQFQVAATPGGTPLGSTSRSLPLNGSKQPSDLQVTRCPSLNINGRGAVSVRDPTGAPLLSANQLPFGPHPQQFFATLTYDAVMNCWLMSGGSSSKFSVGLNNAVPIEICFQLCKELGMHPYFSIPGYALDAATDYATSLASYCIANDPGWMIPRFEPGNEVWNGLVPGGITGYAVNKAQIYWGSQFDQDNWYGKALSVMGQGLAHVFGAANLGVKYHVYCGSQYVTGKPYPEPRLTAASYVAQSAPPQSGYAKVSALSPTKLVSAMLSANYLNPTMQNQNTELQNAWQYAITNAGNSTAQMANLNACVDTLPAAGQPPNYYTGTAAWGTSHGINVMHGYEGGFSPDLVNLPSWGSSWLSAISAATVTSPTSCKLTLPYTTAIHAGGGTSSNSGTPALTGMLIAVHGVGGMTQLNTMVGATATMTGGSSTISATNTLIAGQGVMFAGNAIVPPGFKTLTPYYVLAAGLTSSAFQLSATPGGTPIIADPTMIYSTTGPYGATWTQCYFESGWFANGVIGNDVMLNVINSASFGAYTASTGTAYYLGSTTLVDNFRLACLSSATDMSVRTKANYDNYAAAGGSFPSQYEISGIANIWSPIQPDIYAAPGQEWQAIVAYNH
jgi:hypothetical protein